MRHIYVDLDDVLAQTARGFLQILAEVFDKEVAFEEITQFDLGVSFDLTPEELDRFLVEAHRPERLMEFEPVDGAVDVLSRWAGEGRTVDILTGRPPSSNDASRAWLKRHDFPHREVFFVDKYTRYDDAAWEGHGRVLTLDELHGDRYDVVVEDSLKTAVYLAENTSARVLLLDRPWNRGVQEISKSTLDRIERLDSWEDVSARLSTSGV